MNIRYAGTTIKLARKSCNMTQNEFANGICEPSTLSRIESGTCGVSPETFHKLMSKAGIHFSVYPEFQDKNEFDVFRTLQNLAYDIDSWKFQEAMQELSFIESHNYGNNRLFYQETLTCKAEFMLRIDHPDYSRIYEMLDQVIIMDYPNFRYQDFGDYFLTYNTIHALALLGECMVQLGEYQSGRSLAKEVERYIEHYNMSSEEKAQLLCKNGLTLVRYSLAKKQWANASSLCQYYTDFGAKFQTYSTLPAFYFLWSLSLFHSNKLKDATEKLNISFGSSYFFNNGYSNFILDTLEKDHLPVTLTEEAYPRSIINFSDYYQNVLFTKKLTGYTPMPEKSEDQHYKLGDIIYDARRSQKLSLADLSEGLCSLSKLSKIEKGTLQPDCFLSEALLQRLGLSSNLIMTYASNKEFEIAELKKQLFNTASFDGRDAAMEVLSKIECLIDSDDIINQQFILMYQSVQYCYTDSINLEKLEQALAMTLPNFNYDNIKNFCFTANEITLINNINLCLSADPLLNHEIIDHMKALLAPSDNLGNNEKDLNRSFSVTVSLLILTLYRTKSYQEVIFYFKKFSVYFNLMACRSYSMILSSVCQSQFELGLIKEGISCARAAVSMLNMIANKKNAELLQQYIKEDFNILL